MADYKINITIDGVEKTVTSIGEMEQALQSTNEEITKIGTGGEEFSKLNKQAKDIEKTFTSTTKSANNLDKSIDNITSSVKNMGNTIKTGGDLAAELDKDGKSADNLTDRIEITANTSKSLKAQLRQVINELANLEPGAKGFDELSNKAGLLRDQIQDTNAVVNALAGNTTERLGKALTTTTQIGIAGFQAFSSIVALAGDDNKELMETMVKLQALMNLSQAIETFGGLSDKIVEIKAGFSTLTALIAKHTTAMFADAGATTTQAGATVVATGATRAFGIALKAIPFVAIAAAIGSVVYGIASYLGHSKEAKELDEKRAKALEELNEKQKIEKEGVAEASVAFVTLAERLKATNSGSTERNKLITTINKQYGTTLKNLSDENLFQKQVNGAVEEYIQFQLNRMKLQANEKEINKLLQEKVTIDKDLAKAEKDYATQLDYATKNDDPYGSQAESANKLLQKVIGLQAAQKGNYIGLTNLGVVEQDLVKTQDKLTNGGKKYEDQTKRNEAAEAARAKALAEIKLAGEEINASNEKFAKLEEQRATDRAKLTTSLIDDMQNEKAIALDTAQKSYAASEEKITKEIKNAKLRKETLQTLESDYYIYITKLNDDYNAKIAERTKIELEEQSKMFEKLKNDKIGYLETYDIKMDQIEINRLNNIINDNKTTTEDLEKALKQREALQIDMFNRLEQNELQSLETTKNANLKAREEYYESTYGIAIKYNDKTKQYELDSTAKANKRQENESDESWANRQAIAKQSLENINTEAINIEKDLNADKLVIDNKYNTDRENAAKDTDQKIADNALTIWQKRLELAQSFADGLSAINNLINQTETQNQTAANEKFIAEQQAKVDAIEQAYQDDVANNAYSEDEKTNKRATATAQIEKIQTDSAKVIDKNNEALAKKQFERQKALNITNALINGAQAVMQAISIFGPPPSPFGVAGIVAAGTITAAQVAMIASQKYNGGSTGATSVEIPSVETTTSPVTTASNGGFTGFNTNVTNPQTATTNTQTTAQAPLKVYVLESDITNTQNRVSILESNASFG